MHYVGISTYQFIPCYVTRNTRILKTFEDSEPTGLKVDIAIAQQLSRKNVSPREKVCLLGFNAIFFFFFFTHNDG